MKPTRKIAVTVTALAAMLMLLVSLTSAPVPPPAPATTPPAELQVRPGTAEPSREDEKPTPPLHDLRILGALLLAQS